MTTDILTDNEAIDFSKRLNQALDMAGYPAAGNGRQRAVSSTFQVSPQAAQKWLDARSIPKPLRVNVIAKALGVNSQWLISGQGAIQPDIPAENIADIQAQYNPNAELNYAINQLPKALQTILRRQFTEMFRAIHVHTNNTDNT